MKKAIMRLVEFAVEKPKLVVLFSIIFTILFAAQFPKIKIDTDPENMLREDEAIRVFHKNVKKDFGIEELIVLGIVRDDGIFHRDSLEKVQRITDEILNLKGVISDDVESLTVTKNVVAGDGTLYVRPPMTGIPETPGDIERLGKEVLDNPLFKDRLVSSDGRGAVIYIPIESKDIAHEIGKEITAIYKKEKGPEKYYMAGLPIAEDTFGYEMFLQMGLFAPMAGGLLMLVLFIIFRRVSLIISPMILAMLSVIWTMGAMIGAGFTVHIMSSMIPVFLMPIAICDSVHILSDFYEKLPRLQDRKKAILGVFDELVKPMFFTSLTTAVGFSMLAMADIPPVRVFGIFVAGGVLIAWLLSMTFLPAALVLIRERKPIPLKKEGSPMLGRLGAFSLGKSKAIVTAGAAIVALSIYGVTTLSVNDNPVKWFKQSHPIRVADKELNQLIGGTYISYLVLEGQSEDSIKEPGVMNYMEKLQNHLESGHLVGKTTSVADVVKRVNYVLHDEDKRYEALPEEKNTIGQYLFLFLMSSSPDELDNFVDYSFKKANIWVQLKSGDNKDMTAVVRDVENYVKDNPLPDGVKMQWSGLPYLNIVWQKLMVVGMLKATIGSWWIILVLLIIQFRSFWWGLVGMLPLGLSVLFSYGLIGYAGKDYDMPIAVCSTLALGLGVDFAIHFVQRFRDKFRETGDLSSSMQWTMGGEPALAIFRNAVVVGLGFLPMVFATLGPYVTVGLFFGSLSFFAGLTTLIFLPALIGSFKGLLLKQAKIAAK
jgi:predicted RND superfamily exporter protein